MKSLKCLFTILIISSVGFGQNYNRPVPSAVYPYEFQSIQSGFDGYILTSAYLFGVQNQLANLCILDSNGYLVWWSAGLEYKLNFKYVESENMYSYSSGQGSGNVHHYRMDAGLNLVDTIKVLFETNERGDVHEFLHASNGNRLVLTQPDSTMDLSSYMIAGAPGYPNTDVRAAGIREYDAQGNVVWTWNSLDHIHPSEFIQGYPYNTNKFDYAHVNSIDEDLDGNLLMSFRHLDLCAKIDRITGQIIWRLGGVNSDFTFPNDPERHSGQHTFRRLKNGNYGMFDNGNQKTNQYSRIVEYDLDTINWTATKVDEYDANEANYCPGQGSYQNEYPNYKCIGWGNARRPEPSATILNNVNEVLREIYMKDTAISYRVHAYPQISDLPRPQIICETVSGVTTLSLDSSYAYYLWSTGEGTSTIEVTTPGTYMVWVTYGEGMIGSFPFDFSGNCNASLDEEGLHEEVEVEGIYDLLGRPLTEIAPSKPYIIRYTNGTTERIMQF